MMMIVLLIDHSYYDATNFPPSLHPPPPWRWSPHPAGSVSGWAAAAVPRAPWAWRHSGWWALVVRAPERKEPPAAAAVMEEAFKHGWRNICENMGNTPNKWKF